MTDNLKSVGVGGRASGVMMSKRTTHGHGSAPGKIPTPMRTRTRLNSILGTDYSAQARAARPCRGVPNKGLVGFSSAIMG